MNSRRVKLKRFWSRFQTPCFEAMVSMDRAYGRFYDTEIQLFVEILYHALTKELGSDANEFRTTVISLPKHAFKAARPGGHFLSERPEKCAPMAGGAGVL
jgi:hypothetical protein